MNLVCRSCRRPHGACNCPKGVSPQPADLVPGRDIEGGIRRHADEIRMRILRRILDNAEWANLVDMAVDRATSIGAQQYGDASYYKTDSELAWEGACEISDLIFYEHVPLERAQEPRR